MRPRLLEQRSRRPGRFTSIHLDQPPITTRASHYWWPDRGQSRLSFPPRLKNLRGYSPGYHCEHLAFDVRRHGRAIRVDGGALAPGCFTAGIPNTVAHMPESANARTTEIAAAAPPITLCSPTTPVGTTVNYVTKTESAPQSAATSRGTSPSNTLPPAERLQSVETPPPKGNLQRRTLIAVNVCTTSSGRLFFMDRTPKRDT